MTDNNNRKVLAKAQFSNDLSTALDLAKSLVARLPESRHNCDDCGDDHFKAAEDVVVLLESAYGRASTFDAPIIDKLITVENEAIMRLIDAVFNNNPMMGGLVQVIGGNPAPMFYIGMILGYIIGEADAAAVNTLLKDIDLEF